MDTINLALAEPSCSFTRQQKPQLKPPIAKIRASCGGEGMDKPNSRLAMPWNWNSHGLPFLPGYTFRDVTKSAFHRPQTLEYKSGYALPRRPTVGIGQEPLISEQLTQQEISDLSFETSDITYGSHEHSLAEDFIPAHVALDKKVLRFYAYFKESILYSPEEQYRVRPVVIYYFLEDDSMCIIEPMVENSGIPQGKRIKRQRLPKNERGEHYQWKDLNLSMDLDVYGVKYRITQCDSFTKEFMESEGILLSDPESMPVDPYSKRRKNPQPSYTTPSEFDRMHQFLTLDRKVLHFFALWDDADSLYGETRPVTIQYFLVDDTVEIREVHEPNSGRDPFPVLMRRQKLPKKIKPGSFPSCVLEVSAEEVDEYYSPKDFQVGQTMTLLGRRFLLYDCDRFTKEYYQQNHPNMEMKPIELPKKSDMTQEKKEVPPYNGFGSLEDSLQNCLSLIPKPPKKNVLKMLENDHNVLRYSARLDSQNPEDEVRRFILSYFLSNDVISIFEKPTRNSGIIGGKFLEKTRIPKPGSTVENPVFYSPADFAIGATVEVFGHRFVLTDADHYVLTYMESNTSQIPSQTLDSLHQKLGVGMANNQPAGQNGEDVAELSS
ncbi:EF-hand domain-containing protein 1 [Morone saxatilis]|uniref:EF-hand domain-containing protein 1 n=1 Tax=Morone saxatilis TaxID=34816 RepID=UPI0015E24E41|nr:EF-hand domain-containing protein 1 [Morone saxatilis]